MNRRRIITRVIVFLLLGAIMNVAAAWSLAAVLDLNSAPSQVHDFRLEASLPKYRIVTWSTIGAARVAYFGERADYASGRAREPAPRVPISIPWWGDRDVSEYRWEPYGYHPPIREVFGWPMHSLWSEHVYAGGAWKPGARFGGWPIGDSRTGPNGWIIDRTIPLNPHWPGFAINTVLYAAILWLLFAAPGTIRRRRRIKRGLCPGCAYPVGASEVCTECGKRVKGALT